MTWTDAGLWSLPPRNGGVHDRRMNDAHRFSNGPEGERPDTPTTGDTSAGAAHDRRRVEPMRLTPLLPRRQNPWLLVDVDGSPASHGALVWALREAARREATVVAAGRDVPTDEDVARPIPRGPGVHIALHDRRIRRTVHPPEQRHAHCRGPENS